MSHPPTTPEPISSSDRTRWFAEEVQPHDALLKAYLRSAYPAVRDVDDVVQESYVRLWRARAMKLNVTERETLNTGLAAEVDQWLTERLAVWQTIVDPRVNRPWFTESYNGARAIDYYNTSVRSPLKIAQALQGKRRPQDYRYGANYSTSFALATITDHRWLKRFTVGASARWQDKRAIGYYGVETLPAIIESADVTRPIYDRPPVNFDAFATYRTRIFFDKVGLSVQLNVRNLQEDKARLQPVRAEVDGSISAYRIIDPRQFILTATFSL